MRFDVLSINFKSFVCRVYTPSGHGPLRLSGPWDMVPGTLGPCPFRILGPWDLVD